MYSGCSILYRQAIVVELFSVFQSLKHFWGWMKDLLPLGKNTAKQITLNECVDV